MDLCTKFPIVEGSQYAIHEGGLVEMYLENTWRPNLSITGIDGMPKIALAGNAVRPFTSLRLSMRLCPLTDSEKAVELIKEIITKEVPYNAQVTILNSHGGAGWCMKETVEWF